MSEVALPPQEYLLLDYARRLDRHRVGQRGVHIHPSRLRAQNRRDHHVRIAANTVEDFVKAHEGQMFLLSSGDLIYVVKNASLTQLDDSVMKLRYLFSEDPLTQLDSGDAGHGRFATVYNVEKHYSRFLELCEQVYEEDRARKRRLAEMESESGAFEEDLRKPLGPDQLGKLEDFLNRSDLTSVMRRQPICAVIPKASPTTTFNELYVSIADLAQTVLPDVNLAANRWLFQHLTQVLDKRVLKLLAKADESALHASFSVNLNVSTILSQEFMDFDASLRTGSRGTILVELQLIDIFADYSAFVFARDFCKERGYRVCIDGVTHLTLPFVDRQRLSIDLVKLAWSPELADDGISHKAEQLSEFVASIGKNRVILSRCDNATAVETGQTMGITMFQGRHLDFLLQDEARRHYKPAPKTRRRAS